MLQGITPENIGTIRPEDLLGAADLFDSKYREHQ